MSSVGTDPGGQPGAAAGGALQRAHLRLLPPQHRAGPVPRLAGVREQLRLGQGDGPGLPGEYRELERDK